MAQSIRVEIFGPTDREEGVFLTKHTLGTKNPLQKYPTDTEKNKNVEKGIGGT